MATHSDITRLRKEGKLDEALALALELRAQYPDDIWIGRAYAWAIYALTKRSFEKGDLPEAGAYFQSYEALQMGPEETLLHETFNYFRLRLHPKALRAKKLSDEKKHREALKLLLELQGEEALKNSAALQTKIAWEIWRNLQTLTEDSAANAKALDKLAALYRSLHFLPRPSMPHSVALNQLLRLPPGLKESFDFADWFRFWRIPEDFTEKDWEPYVANDRKLPSLAERACNAWCRALLKNIRTFPDEEIHQALEKLEAISDAHPDFAWLPYFTAKIRLSASEEDPSGARERLIPFVKAKHTEFWAWDLLADAYGEKEPEALEACLCKALSCRAEPHFLTKVRVRLAEALIKRQDFAAARREVEEVERLKEERAEQLPPKVRFWLQTPWYQDAGAASPEAQRQLYTRGAEAAEALVFGDDMAQGTGVIEGIDPNTGTVFFALRPEIRGRFSAGRYTKHKFQPGDLAAFKLRRVEKNGKSFWQIIQIGPPADPPHRDIYRIFSGPFRQKSGQAFGFIGEAFVPPQLVARLRLSDGQQAEAHAVWSKEPKKEKYGWKTLKITTNH